MPHTPDSLPVTPFVHARVTLERLARRAAKLDAGRVPNKLVAYAAVVRYAAEEHAWERLDAVAADLAELLRVREYLDPDDPVTAILREAQITLAALRAPEAHDGETVGRRAAT